MLNLYEENNVIVITVVSSGIMRSLGGLISFLESNNI